MLPVGHGIYPFPADMNITLAQKVGRDQPIDGTRVLKVGRDRSPGPNGGCAYVLHCIVLLYICFRFFLIFFTFISSCSVTAMQKKTINEYNYILKRPWSFITSQLITPAFTRNHLIVVRILCMSLSNFAMFLIKYRQC